MSSTLTVAGLWLACVPCHFLSVLVPGSRWQCSFRRSSSGRVIVESLNRAIFRILSNLLSHSTTNFPITSIRIRKVMTNLDCCRIFVPKSRRKNRCHREREPTKISNLKSIASHTWALDVTDDRTRGVVHELNADLGDTTTGTCPR